jgi:hypothetical protein
MKTLITALTLAILIAAPAFVQSANAAPPSDRRDCAGQSYCGTFQGYPLTEWYRPDSW